MAGIYLTASHTKLSRYQSQPFIQHSLPIPESFVWPLSKNAIIPVLSPPWSTTRPHPSRLLPDLISNTSEILARVFQSRNSTLELVDAVSESTHRDLQSLEIGFQSVVWKFLIEYGVDLPLHAVFLVDDGADLLSKALNALLVYEDLALEPAKLR